MQTGHRQTRSSLSTGYDLHPHAARAYSRLGDLKSDEHDFAALPAQPVAASDEIAAEKAAEVNALIVAQVKGVAPS